MIMTSYLLLQSTLVNVEYDLECIIDDWVFLGFLVGNDFIPHLPDLHINSNALPFLYQTYISVMPSLDGYINEGGIINLKRFQKYLQAISNVRGSTYFAIIFYNTYYHSSGLFTFPES